MRLLEVQVYCRFRMGAYFSKSKIKYFTPAVIVTVSSPLLQDVRIPESMLAICAVPTHSQAIIYRALHFILIC